MAEYNYAMYRGLISVEVEEISSQKVDRASCNAEAEKVDKSPDEYLCGNLIYDEDYIPTTIDIVD